MRHLNLTPTAQVKKNEFKTKIAALANQSSSQVLVFLSFPPPPINLCYRNCDGEMNKPERYLSKRLGHKLILRSIKTRTNFIRRQRTDFLSQINLPSASWYATLHCDAMSKIYVPLPVLELIKFIQFHREETLPSPLRREASDGSLRLVLPPPFLLFLLLQFFFLRRLATVSALYYPPAALACHCNFLCTGFFFFQSLTFISAGLIFNNLSSDFKLTKFGV